MQNTFEVKGLKETLKIFDDLRDEIGDARKSSNILVKTVKEAMKPVLSMAQSLTASHSQTGLLHDSLTIVGRRPTNKDKTSRYVNANDAAIAMVTTKPIPRSLKKEGFKQFGHLRGSELKKAKKTFYESAGVFYDARAIASEFGTKNRPAHPYLRVSLESQQQQVSDSVARILQQYIEKFKSL